MMLLARELRAVLFLEVEHRIAQLAMFTAAELVAIFREPAVEPFG